MEPEKLGAALTSLRKKANVGLRELARMAEMSPASLVAIEKGASSPNLATLHKLLRVLNTSFAEFFAGGGEESQLPVFAGAQMRSVCDAHREYRFLFPRRVDIKFEMVHETIAPSEQEATWEAHDCDLGGVVLSGQGQLEIEGQGQWELKQGDSFYIKAGAKHRLLNLGKRPIKQITVMDPPRY